MLKCRVSGFVGCLYACMHHLAMAVLAPWRRNPIARSARGLTTLGSARFSFPNLNLIPPNYVGQRAHAHEKEGGEGGGGKAACLVVAPGAGCFLPRQIRSICQVTGSRWFSLTVLEAIIYSLCVCVCVQVCDYPLWHAYTHTHVCMQIAMQWLYIAAPEGEGNFQQLARTSSLAVHALSRSLSLPLFLSLSLSLSLSFSPDAFVQFNFQVPISATKMCKMFKITMRYSMNQWDDSR